MNSKPALTPLLGLIDSPAASTVEYVIGGQTLSTLDRETVAHLLADDAMMIACGASPVLGRWRARRDGGPALTGAQHEAVKTYAGIAFGSPSNKKED